MYWLPLHWAKRLPWEKSPTHSVSKENIIIHLESCLCLPNESESNFQPLLAQFLLSTNSTGRYQPTAYCLITQLASNIDIWLHACCDIRWPKLNVRTIAYAKVDLMCIQIKGGFDKLVVKVVSELISMKHVAPTAPKHIQTKPDDCLMKPMFALWWIK